MDRIKEEQGANALVQIFALAAERIQRSAVREQTVGRKAMASGIERLVAERRIRRRDESNQIPHTGSERDVAAILFLIGFLSALAFGLLFFLSFTFRMLRIPPG